MRRWSPARPALTPYLVKDTRKGESNAQNIEYDGVSVFILIISVFMYVNPTTSARAAQPAVPRYFRR